MKTGNGPKNEEMDPKKRGNRSTNWEFKSFFLKTGNGPKIYGNRPKIYRKPINKLKFFNFFQDTRNEPKICGMDRQIYTGQQIEIVLLCLKTISGPKICGNGSKILGNPSKIQICGWISEYFWSFPVFFRFPRFRF